MKTTKSFYTDTRWWEKLRTIAKERGLSLSELLNSLIETFLRQEDRLPSQNGDSHE